MSGSFSFFELLCSFFHITSWPDPSAFCNAVGKHRCLRLHLFFFVLFWTFSSTQLGMSYNRYQLCLFANLCSHVHITGGCSIGGITDCFSIASGANPNLTLCNSSCYPSTSTGLAQAPVTAATPWEGGRGKMGGIGIWKCQAICNDKVKYCLWFVCLCSSIFVLSPVEHLNSLIIASL